MNTFIILKSYISASKETEVVDENVKARSKREAVIQYYSRAYNYNYFPQEDGRILDCDGHEIMSHDDTIIDAVDYQIFAEPQISINYACYPSNTEVMVKQYNGDDTDVVIDSTIKTTYDDIYPPNYDSVEEWVETEIDSLIEEISEKTRYSKTITVQLINDSDIDDLKNQLIRKVEHLFV